MRRVLLFALFLLAVPAYAQYAPNVPASSVKDFKFTTRTTTGAPTTLSGGTIVAYKGNNLTESPTGITLTADFDGRTGLNNIHIDLSSDTTFYSANADIALVLSAGTVGGTSVVGETVVQFHISSDYTIQKGVAFPNYPIWMVSANGSAVLGATVTCTIAKDAGAFAASTNAVSEVGSGKYLLSFTATETSAGSMTLLCTATGAAAYRVVITPQQ